MLEIFLEYWEIVLTFFVIAVLYASVGFGGGSSYIAVLTLTGLAFTEIRFIALCCNIVVVATNCLHFLRQKQLNFKKIIPLILISVPMAFIGGYVKINQIFFQVVLALILLLASVFMWFTNLISKKNDKNSTFKNIAFGGGIGFISGLVGIGGGIFLSPLLHLSSWDTPKKIAATSSFFILVNSIAGIVGQQLSFNVTIHWQFVVLLAVAVCVGGQIGNRFSNSFLSSVALKKATAVLIAFVSTRILWNIFN